MRILSLALVVLSTAFASVEGIESAASLIKDGKVDEAIAQIQKEIDEHPENARAHELLALAYLKQNKLPAAENSAKQALSLDSSGASVHLSMARVAIARQNWTLADKELTAAHEIDSSVADIQLYRGSLNLAKRDYKGAVQVLTPYVHDNPDEAYGHYYLGLAQYSLKRPDKTVEHFQRFLALAPHAPEAARVESLLRSIR